MPGKNSSTVVANEWCAFSAILHVHATEHARAHPCTLMILAASLATVTNVSRGKCTLARLREAGLDFLENPFDQNNDVPLLRFLSSFAHDRRKIIQRGLFLLFWKARFYRCDILSGISIYFICKLRCNRKIIFFR